MFINKLLLTRVNTHTECPQWASVWCSHFGNIGADQVIKTVQRRGSFPAAFVGCFGIKTPAEPVA